MFKGVDICVIVLGSSAGDWAV